MAPSRTRRWKKALLGLVVAGVFLCLLEGVLALFGVRPIVESEDPFVGFASYVPLFVPAERNDGTPVLRTALNKRPLFNFQEFPREKADGAFRIFCLGGSTVQGRPYSVETSFTTWLQLDLEAARPETNWEIINCGGISYASYRLVPIMAELLDHEPDLFVVYTGHNEFLEDRTYGHVKRTPRVLVRLHRTLLGLRSYALADRWLADRRAKRTDAARPLKTVLAPEVRAKLDLRKGLEAYHRDPMWRQGTIDHFHRNLETLVRMARNVEVPVILVNPVANLKDCPPFKSQFRTDLTEAEREHVLNLWERAQQLGWSNVHEKIGLLEQAAAIDNQHAGLLYLIGMCYEHVGRATEAKQWFVRAKEQDICPLRILEPMHEAILEVAAQYHVPLADARATIEQQTEDGIPGSDWLLDHVHPSIAGHQLIAEALYQVMAEMNLAPPPGDWRARRENRRQQHLATLNDAYYAQGKARLRRLQEWSRGRIPKSSAHPADASNDRP